MSQNMEQLNKYNIYLQSLSLNRDQDCLTGSLSLLMLAAQGCSSNL